MSVIKGIQGGLSSMMPEADQSFGQISDLLSNIMNDSSQIPNTEISGTGMISEDSMKILEDASMVIEQSMKDKFPDLPSSSEIDQESSEASIY
ncbi:MAG: hypothetical protein ACXWFZ_10090, partial [Nitrososphaeraceae archaeon]